ncbi:metallophosphoesterase [Actinoplanes sp. NPDC004185]
MIVFVVLPLVLLLPTAFFALHWYVWRRLIHDTTTPGSPIRRAGTALFVAGPLLLLLALPHDLPGVPFRAEAIIDWPGFMWLALFLYLFLALAAGEVVRPLLHRRVSRRRTAQSEHPTTQPVVSPASPPLSRRVFVSRVVGGSAAALALTTVSYGTFGLLRGPRVKRITVPMAKLPRSADGFRIAVVSDMHLGPLLGRDFARRVVDTINSTQPDLITVVGDLVDGSVADLRPAVAPLARLRARHGAFFVTGNHEYLFDAQQWISAVRDLGVHPLENSRVELPGFDLAGVNDVAGAGQGQGPDFARALGDRDRARTAVLLAHQPVVIDDAVAHGVDLQLSGHTHGGQLWPGPYVAELVVPTVAGLERYGDTQLYVSRGAGAWGPPVRVDAPSDITVIELAST